jgi:hypothetical protein
MRLTEETEEEFAPVDSTALSLLLPLLVVVVVVVVETNQSIGKQVAD